MSSRTLDDVTERLVASDPTPIGQGLAAARAGVAQLQQHPHAAVQRSAADAMLLLFVARDTVLHLVPDAPEPALDQLPRDYLHAEVVSLLDALATRLVAAEQAPAAIDSMAAAQASLHVLEAADLLRS
jgi:hypothetical protein